MESVTKNSELPKFLLGDPALAGIDVGSSGWFKKQRDLIHSRPLLKHCYDIWYRELLADADSVPKRAGAPKPVLLELGSGGSYLKELRPGVITSDIVPGVADQVVFADHLPFADQTISALFLTHAFHHFPDVEKFLQEAERVLIPGGVLSMIEIAHTPFGRFFFTFFHPEPYDSRVASWKLDQKHAMMDANQALSWIVFYRDAKIFRKKFPNLIIEKRAYLPWLSYLLSGGVTRKSFVPKFLAPPILKLEKFFFWLSPVFALHWHLTIRKAGSEKE